MSKRNIIIISVIVLGLFSVLIIPGIIVPVLSSEHLAQQYLEKKYGEDFTLVADKNHEDEMIFCPGVVLYSAEPKGKFIVRETGFNKFEDDYYSVCVYDTIHDKLDEIAGQYFDNYDIYINFENDFFNTVWDRSTPVAWAMEDNPDYFAATVGVFTSDEIEDKDFDKFYAEVTEYLPDNQIGIYQMVSGNLASVNRDNFRYYMSKYRYTNYLKGYYDSKEE